LHLLSLLLTVAIRRFLFSFFFCVSVESEVFVCFGGVKLRPVFFLVGSARQLQYYSIFFDFDEVASGHRALYVRLGWQ
jgi:hypothetical protein